MKLISEQVLAIIKKEYPKAMLQNYTVTKKRRLVRDTATPDVHGRTQKEINPAAIPER